MSARRRGGGVELGLLGPLQVRSNGCAVAVGGSRERAVLTRLVLSANQVVPLETLADDLWAGHPPEGAAQALWVYVSRLRKALRQHGGEGMLVTRAPGYALEIDLTALDSTRFETLVAEARAHGGADPESAARRYREALALWRGPALADVADLPFAQGEAGRLEEARLAALEERIDADLACGRHGELIGELTGLTRDHPLRERFWAQRMTALYRAGRQAEALRAYQDLRRFLGDELGIEPTEEVRRLEAAILRHEPALDWRPATPPTMVEPDLRTGPHPPQAGEPGPAPMLAGVVTFLFSDLAGSTELLQSLGDDAADELHRRYFTLMRQALAAHGGTEVKSLGDGLMAAFASPLAAVSAAVAMQEAMDRENEGRGGTALSVRVGLHAGEAIGEGDDYFGTPVVVAQRLCDRARGGQVLASALLAGLVGNRGDHSFRALGGLALKGLSEPIAACEVVWERHGQAAVPLPIPLERDESSIFVGRDGEMVALGADWEAARSGRRRVVLVVGEPGIGKSRLAAELARQAHQGGATVLFGRCDEGTGIPYQPFVEALGAYLRTARAPVLGRLGAELARLVPEVATQVADLPPPVRSDPETERYRLFDAVAAWLAAVSVEAPTLLVLDDLHWATQPTLSLLAHLVRSGEPLRLLVVATCRDSTLDLTAEMADATVDLLRQPGVDRLRLDGLDERGVAAFMQATARHELDDDVRALAGDLRTETGGNPFFVGQLLRHLTETGAVVRRDGRWTWERLSEFGVPESVRDVVSQRLARLPDETRAVLARAAVMGVSFELAPLVHAGDGREVEVLRALDPAFAARLVTETGDGYRFVHTLVRATLYDGLPRAHRVELHRRIGEALETVYASRLDHHLTALAYQFARAGLAQRAKASAYAARAGDRALAQLAHNEAIGWYAEALVLFDSGGLADEGRRCDLLIALGEAQHRVGDRSARDTLLEAARDARALQDSERLARAAMANHMGPGLVFRPVDAERIDLLHEALAVAPPGDSAVRARLMATLAAELANSPDHERRQQLVTEAVDMARRLADPVALAQVLSSAYVPFVELRGRPEQWEEMRRDLTEVSRYLGDPTLEFWSVFAAWAGAMMSQDLAGSLEMLELMRLLGDDVGQPLLRWTAAYARSGQSITGGRFAEAEALAHEAYELGAAAGIMDATRLLWSQLFWIRYEQGRIGEVLDVYARAGRRPGARAHTRVLLCVLLCELDRPEEARPVFDALAADGFAGVHYPWIQSLAVMAKACAVLGTPDQCALLCDRLASHRTLVPTFTITTIEPVAYHLGLLRTRLGRYAEAEADFDEAERIAERMGAPHWRARIDLQRAWMFSRRAGPGDAEQALQAAEAALTAAETLGMGRVAQQARNLTTAGEARAASAPPTPPAGPARH